VATVTAFSVGQRRQFVQDFLQSFKPTFVIRGSERFLAALQTQAIGLPDFRDLLPQLFNAFSDGSCMTTG
jgi:hypothetical protein